MTVMIEVDGKGAPTGGEEGQCEQNHVEWCDDVMEQPICAECGCLVDDYDYSQMSPKLPGDD